MDYLFFYYFCMETHGEIVLLLYSSNLYTPPGHENKISKDEFRQKNKF